jgi:hypothetical protein
MPFDLEAFRYYIENPSAWENGFDQKVSDQMNAATKEIERRGNLIMRLSEMAQSATAGLSK